MISWDFKAAFGLDVQPEGHFLRHSVPWQTFNPSPQADSGSPGEAALLWTACSSFSRALEALISMGPVSHELRIPRG